MSSPQRWTVLALVVTAALLAFWGTTGAQVIDGDPCRDACYAEKADCITDCSRHRNPMECEAKCQTALHDCLRACH